MRSGRLKRAPGGRSPFVKGHHIGRPKGAQNLVTRELGEAARVYTLPMLEVLVAIAHDKRAPKMARVAAAQGVLDRGHGRPRQAIDVTTESWPIFVSDVEPAVV